MKRNKDRRKELKKKIKMAKDARRMLESFEPKMDDYHKIIEEGKQAKAELDRMDREDKSLDN